MLGKLLKYDFKSIGKRVIPLCMITFLMCLLTRGLYAFSEKQQIFAILSFFTNLIGLLGLIALPFATFFFCFKRYHTNLFKEEGYLTNVLPVKMNLHILSKFIVSIVYSVISIGIMIISFFTMYYDIAFTEGIAQVIELFGGMAGLFVTYIILAYLNYLFLFFAAYSIGQMNQKRKILTAILSGFGLYMITQVINLLGLFIYQIWNPEMLTQVENGNLEIIKSLFILMSVVSSIYMIGYYFITTVALKKKMDLE